MDTIVIDLAEEQAAVQSGGKCSPARYSLDDLLRRIIGECDWTAGWRLPSKHLPELEPAQEIRYYNRPSLTPDN